MYAIVEVGGKQCKVAKDEQILLEAAVSERRRKFSLDKVLLTVKDKNVEIGEPYLKNVKVNCEVQAHLRAKKKIAFKFRRRKNSESIRGHRQKMILVKVKEIKTL